MPSFAAEHLIGRTSSSPNLSTCSPRPLVSKSQQSNDLIINMGILTPPRSPSLDRVTSHRQTSKVHQVTNTRTSRSQSMEECGRPSSAADQERENEDLHTIECPFEFDIVKTHGGRPELFGQGVWSRVYKATGRSRLTRTSISSHGALTPPTSPTSHTPLIVAVKSPLSKASKSIIESEAYLLSRLMRTPGHKSFIVPFYGFVPSLHSIVLKAIPLSLSKHIATCDKLARLHEAPLTSTTPVVGSVPIWRSLAGLLVSAVAWLHDFAGIIHGDVKPANVLLCADHQASPNAFPYRPLLIDFSSSHILASSTSLTNEDPTARPSSPPSPVSPGALSAVTREYTAPELLSPSILRDPASTPTSASDIFSLAITLLVCATGDLAVYPGNVWQRQHMAMHGWDVLNFVRSGDSGLRVPAGGEVEEVLENAVLKAGRGRITARDWVALIEQRRDER